MEKIRIDLVRLKTEEDALKRFGRLKGMPTDYNSELEELHGIFTSMGQAIKNRDRYRRKYRPVYKAYGDARGCKNDK